MALSWRGGVRVVLPPLCVYVVDGAQIANRSRMPSPASHEHWKAREVLHA